MLYIEKNINIIYLLLVLISFDNPNHKHFQCNQIFFYNKLLICNPNTLQFHNYSLEISKT